MRGTSITDKDSSDKRLVLLASEQNLSSVNRPQSNFTLTLLWRLHRQTPATSLSRRRLCRLTDDDSRASGLKTLGMPTLKVNLL